MFSLCWVENVWLCSIKLKVIILVSLMVLVGYPLMWGMNSLRWCLVGMNKERKIGGWLWIIVASHPFPFLKSYIKCLCHFDNKHIIPHRPWKTPFLHYKKNTLSIMQCMTGMGCRLLSYNIYLEWVWEWKNWFLFLSSLVFINIHMNWNDYGFYEKVTKKEKFIHEYPEFDYQGRKLGIRNKFHWNEFWFIYIFIQSK